MNDLSRWREQALGVLRIVAGFLFLQHGAQKLLGWFGGQTVINLKYDVVTKEGMLYVFSKALSHRFNEVHQATQGD